MKVARSIAPREIRIEDMAAPEPGPGEVVCEVLACGVCASDVTDWYVAGKVPTVLGHELAGAVRAVGDGAVAADGSPIELGGNPSPDPRAPELVQRVDSQRAVCIVDCRGVQRLRQHLQIVQCNRPVTNVERHRVCHIRRRRWFLLCAGHGHQLHRLAVEIVAVLGVVARGQVSLLAACIQRVHALLTRFAQRRYHPFAIKIKTGA